MEVFPSTGEVMKAMTENISRCGLQFISTKEMADTLTASQRQLGSADPVEVDVEFSLNLGSNGPVKMRAHGRIVNLRRVARDKYHIGLEYTNLDEQADRYLEQFFNEYSCKDSA